MVKAKLLREAILPASAVTDEPTLTLLPNRIGIRSLDLSEVSMVDMIVVPSRMMRHFPVKPARILALFHFHGYRADELLRKRFAKQWEDYAKEV